MLKLVKRVFCSGPCGGSKAIEPRTSHRCHDCGGRYADPVLKAEFKERLEHAGKCPHWDITENHCSCNDTVATSTNIHPGNCNCPNRAK